MRGMRYLQKNGFAEKEFIKKILGLGQRALKLQLVERPECISKIIFDNALKLCIEKDIVVKGISGDKENEEHLHPGTESRTAYPVLQQADKSFSAFSAFCVAKRALSLADPHPCICGIRR